ncbi:hypothetical protein [Hymenobacter terricola]|uniref:hypothetical protein n=1 Tax=Hymenobacter terricola TaxID=2819236 RepID=UPI001B30287D|nr:hypothetical protein [Hymenobacter terricola]
MKALIVVFASVLFCNTPVTAQSQQAATVPKEQLVVLERENRFLREDLNRTQADLAKLQKNHDELSKALDGYKPILEYWQWLLGVFGFLSLSALITAGWLWFKKIPKAVKDMLDRVPGLAQEQYDAQIKQVFTDRRAELLAVLKEYDADQEVKKKHRVVLLTHRDGIDDYHHTQLIKHGFSVYPYTKVDTLAAAVNAGDIKPDDIIVINNEGKHWLPEEVQKFIHNNPQCCFYIGRGEISLDSEAISRFAAANFRPQFIGNLMNILRYRN